jgi:hypothetical protein
MKNRISLISFCFVLSLCASCGRGREKTIKVLLLRAEYSGVRPNDKLIWVPEIDVVSEEGKHVVTGMAVPSVPDLSKALVNLCPGVSVVKGERQGDYDYMIAVEWAASGYRFSVQSENGGWLDDGSVGTMHDALKQACFDIREDTKSHR